MPPERSESAFLRNLMIGATVIGVLVLMAGFGLLMMSPMLFDSGESVAAWGIFIFVWSMPLLLIAGLAIGWFGFARNREGVVAAGLFIAGLPLMIAMSVIAMAG